MRLRGDDGVSEVVGYILISAIVVVTLSWLAAVALPMITEVQQDTSFTRAQNDLADLQKGMEEVARGPLASAGSARTYRIGLSQDTTLTIDNESGSISVAYNATTATLSGTVRSTNATGDPVSGARVSVVGERYSDSTDGSGSYSLSMLAGSTYLVRAERTGFQSNSTSVDLPADTSLDLVLNVSRGDLSTRVTNGSANLDGVTVTLNGTPHSYLATGRGGEHYVQTNTTGPDGWANFTDVPTGENYTVTFEKDWYVDDERAAVEITSGGNETLNVTMEEAGRINVTVTDSNGPLQGAVATAYNHTAEFAATNTTDATGNATLHGIPVGRHVVSAGAKSHEPNATPVTVTFGSTSTIALSLDGGATTGNLSGTVKDSVDGTYTLGDARVNFTYQGTDFVAAADETGSYAFPVPQGNYKVTADAPDYLPDTTTVTGGGDRTQNFSLTLDTVGHLSGYVTNGSGGNVSNAEVRVRGESSAGWTFTGTDTTGANGHYNITQVVTGPYTIDGIPPGNHTVTASATGYATESTGLLLNRSRTHNVTLQSSSTVTLDGTVTDGNGDPVEDATVSVDSGAYSDLTDASGDYSITLPSGTYDLTADKAGYLPSYAYGTELDTDTTVDFTVVLSLTPGSVHLSAPDREAWLENDLLARGSGGNSAYLRNNFVRVVNSSGTYLVSVHVLTVEQGNFSQAGAAADVTVRFLEFNQIYSRQSENVTLTVQSPVHGAWATLYRRSLRKAGLTEGNGYTITTPPDSGEDTVLVTIEGGSGGNDVVLRIHETRLKLETD